MGPLADIYPGVKMFLTNSSGIGLNSYLNFVLCLEDINTIEEYDKSDTYKGECDNCVNVVEDNIGNALGGNCNLKTINLVSDKDPLFLNNK